LTNYFLEFVVRFGVEIIYFIACAVRGAIYDVQVVVQHVVILRVILIQRRVDVILARLTCLPALLKWIRNLLTIALFVVAMLLFYHLVP
jgi:hypothetical protein